LTAGASFEIGVIKRLRITTSLPLVLLGRYAML
jgi:hypothetical protein